MVFWLNLSTRTKKDTNWLKVMNPFKKLVRSSSPRTRFYVSREDLDGGSIEFEEDEGDDDEADAISSRSFEERSSQRMSRAISAEGLLDTGDNCNGRISRKGVKGELSKSMDELDGVGLGDYFQRSRSYDPLNPETPSKDYNQRLQQQSVSEPGPRSAERGRRMAKTLKKALPWIPRS